jgi:hypothetical protein
MRDAEEQGGILYSYRILHATIGSISLLPNPYWSPYQKLYTAGF